VPTFETGREVDRVVFFSDAVFAIAMTLLAVEIKVPDVPDAQVATTLHHMGREFYGYFLTFAVIGVYWMAHHRMFRFVRRVDNAFIALNMLLLALIGFMPVSSDLFGRHSNSSAAVIFYAFNLCLVGLATLFVWLYATHRHRLVDDSLTQGEIRAGAFRSISVVLLFGLSIPIALVSTSLAEYFWLLLIPLRIVPNRMAKRRGEVLGQ
jgi:uncharacterized membrane protein